MVSGWGVSGVWMGDRCVCGALAPMPGCDRCHCCWLQRCSVDMVWGLMANAKWIAFLLSFSNQWPLKALYNTTLTHSCTHSHTDSGVSHERRQPACREQSGSRPWTPRRWARTSNLLVTSQPALPPELIRPTHTGVS